MKIKKGFPAPIRLTEGTTRWRLSQLAEWDGTEQPTEESYLRVSAVARRYGVSVATIWRWSAVEQDRGAA